MTGDKEFVYTVSVIKDNCIQKIVILRDPQLAIEVFLVYKEIYGEEALVSYGASYFDNLPEVIEQEIDKRKEYRDELQKQLDELLKIKANK